MPDMYIHTKKQTADKLKHFQMKLINSYKELLKYREIW